MHQRLQFPVKVALSPRKEQRCSSPVSLPGQTILKVSSDVMDKGRSSSHTTSWSFASSAALVASTRAPTRSFMVPIIDCFSLFGCCCFSFLFLFEFLWQLFAAARFFYLTKTLVDVNQYNVQRMHIQRPTDGSNVARNTSSIQSYRTELELSDDR
jgi:hypothetical protein